MTNAPAHNGAPLLAACIYSVQGNNDAALKLMESYRIILERRLSYDVAEPDDSGSFFSRNFRKREAQDEWFDLLMELPETGQVLPTFAAIWAETGAVLHLIFGRGPIEEEADKLYDFVEYQGLLLAPMVAQVFEIARSHPQLTSQITSIINAQPRYQDLPINFHNQVNERQRLGGPDVLPDLARFISALSHNPTAINYGIATYAEFVETILSHRDQCLATRVNVSTDGVNQMLNPLVEVHRRRTSDPFSPMSLEIRQQLVQCNVRSTCRLLLKDVTELSLDPRTTNTPGSELAWRLFRKFVDGIMQVANKQGSACVSIIQDELMYLHLDQFLNPFAQPISHWQWNPFGYDDSDDDSEEDLDDLPDVCVEPVGPDFKAEHHATAVTSTSDLPEEECSICRDTLSVYETMRDEVPVKIKCGHCFHYGCLTTLINGISKFSNLCPNCRGEVCKRRPRRLKDGKKLDNAQEVESLNGEEPERFLQDKHGDVVMTDG